MKKKEYKIICEVVFNNKFSIRDYIEQEINLYIDKMSPMIPTKGDGNEEQE